MKIGELARLGECDVETVRFYEREGILEAPARQANGYRSYLDHHLVQLRFIRHCRSLGMGLSDIRSLRSLQSNPNLACDTADQLIDSQIERIHQKVESLRQLEQQLRALRDTCQTQHTTADCGVLLTLASAAEGEDCSCHANGPAIT